MSPALTDAIPAAELFLRGPRLLAGRDADHGLTIALTEPDVTRLLEVARHLAAIVDEQPELALALGVPTGAAALVASRPVLQALAGAGLGDLWLWPDGTPEAALAEPAGPWARLAALPLRVRREPAEPLPNLRHLLRRWLDRVYGGAPRLAGLIPSGSSGNLCWRADRADGSIFVKVRSSGAVRAWEAGRDAAAARAEAEGEARIVEALEGLEGFPRLVRTVAGGAVALFGPGAGGAGQCPVLVQGHVVLREPTWDPDLARRVGRRLAAVHDRLRPLALQAGSALSSKLQRLEVGAAVRQGWLPAHLLAQATRAAAEASGWRATPVHGDVGPGNLGLSEAGEVVLVDFSDFKRDPPALELSRALLWLGVLAGPLRAVESVEVGARLLVGGYRDAGGEAVTPEQVLRLALVHYAFDLEVSLAAAPEGAEREHVLGPFARSRGLMEDLGRRLANRRSTGSR